MRKNYKSTYKIIFIKIVINKKKNEAPDSAVQKKLVYVQVRQTWTRKE